MKPKASNIGSSGGSEVSRSIGGSIGSRPITATSLGYSRAEGRGGTAADFMPASGYGAGGPPRGRKDQPLDEGTHGPKRFDAGASGQGQRNAGSGPVKHGVS
jgi:hypothetical protein